MGRWTRGAALVLAAATIAVGACGDGDDTPAAGSGAGGEHQHENGGGNEATFSAADADSTVDVTMKDFVFIGIPAAVGGGKVFFEVSNEGPSEHELVVFKKGGDDPVGGIEPFAQGKTETLALELEPGPYTVKCLVEVGDQTHADLGMQTDFTVE